MLLMVAYHDFEALLDGEPRAETIVYAWGLDADAWLGEEFAKPRCGFHVLLCV